MSLLYLTWDINLSYASGSVNKSISTGINQHVKLLQYRCTKIDNMDNQLLIHRFYTSFAAADAEGMVSCYDDQVEFCDPAFGRLKGEDAKNMWRMLMQRSKGEIRITFSHVQANDKTGSARWVAEYMFSRTGRKVVNHVAANFEFRDGKIIKHTDHFSFWKWSSQALGWKGALLGWTSFMQKKVQQQSRGLLSAFKN